MGSSLFGVNVSVTGHEKLFYQAIKNHVLSLDNRITCANDPDVEFDRSESGDDHVATLSFSINNEHAFTLYRTGVLYSNNAEVPVCTIGCKMDAVTGIPTSAKAIHFRDGQQVGYTATQSSSIFRGLKISHIINDNFIFLCFSPYELTEWENVKYTEHVRILYTFSDSNTFITSTNAWLNNFNKATLFNLSGYTLYDKALTIPSGVFLSRFSYGAPPGTIDYIKSSIYQNNNEKVFENRAIYDCTTVNVGDTVSLKDGAYLAIGAHQLTKIS